MSSLSLIATNQDEIADTLGIDTRTFQRWLKRGCPGKPKRYVVRECIQWARENAWSEDAVIAEQATGEEGDLKTEYLKAKTEKLKRECQLAEFKIGAANEQLVDIARVAEILNQQSAVFRSGLERLERRFGREPLDMVFELLDEVESIDFGSLTT